MTPYQATYRRSEVALPSLAVVLLLFFAGLYLAITQADGRQIEQAMIGLVVGVVVGLMLVLLTLFRVHRWTIEPLGLRIEERPKVPLTGLRRRVLLPFAQIRHLSRIESGFDRLLEITTTAGQRYRMPQAMIADPRGAPRVDAGATLHDLEAAIRGAAHAAGHDLARTTEGLSFWNSPGGIGFIGVLFVASCAIAGAVGWALVDGMTTQGMRGAQGAAIALLLPVGSGILLVRSIRRRRRVLAAREGR